MAGGTDKARFYLEKSIPDLHELEAKKILSKVTRHPKCEPSKRLRHALISVL